MIIEYQPIGIIRSPFTEVGGMPIQSGLATDAVGTVELDAQYGEGLCDLNGFSHLILVYHFHRSEGFNLKVVPFLDDQERGVFSTRAPKRPNSIGLSIVRLCSIQGTTLSIQDVDILDRTPLLDIKPFVEKFDQRNDTRSGWIEAAGNRSRLSDDRFK